MKAGENFHFQSFPYKINFAHASTNEIFISGKHFKMQMCIRRDKQLVILTLM